MKSNIISTPSTIGKTTWEGYKPDVHIEILDGVLAGVTGCVSGFNNIVNISTPHGFLCINNIDIQHKVVANSTKWMPPCNLFTNGEIIALISDNIFKIVMYHGDVSINNETYIMASNVNGINIIIRMVGFNPSDAVVITDAKIKNKFTVGRLTEYSDTQVFASSRRLSTVYSFPKTI